MIGKSYVRMVWKWTNNEKTNQPMLVSLSLEILHVLCHIFGLIHPWSLAFKIRHFQFKNGEGKDIHRNRVVILFTTWKQQVLSRLINLRSVSCARTKGNIDEMAARLFSTYALLSELYQTPRSEWPIYDVIRVPDAFLHGHGEAT